MIQYISEKISHKDLELWFRRTVVVDAPTGRGKSYCFRETVIPYYLGMPYAKKVLYLVNRRLLKMQLHDMFLEKYGTEEIFTQIELMTYQELAEKIERGEIRNLYDYSLIIADEAHFFVSDSDFNPRGTIVPLMFIALNGLSITKIFASATVDEVFPVIERVFQDAIQATYYDPIKPLHIDAAWAVRKYHQERISKLRRKRQPIDPNLCKPIWIAPYGTRDIEASFLGFECYSVPDIQTLAIQIAKDDGKTIIFRDSKTDAEAIQKEILKAGITDKEILVINSSNVDDSEIAPKVKSMLIRQKFEEKILITTSVLDNGVTLKDSSIHNVAIITESKTSFLQMIGRVRTGDGEKIKLWFLERSAKEFSMKANKLKNLISRFDSIKNSEKKSACIMSAFSFADSVYNNLYEDKMSESLKVYFPLKGEETKTFYLWDELEDYYRHSVLFVRNPLAEVKLRNLYNLLSLFALKAVRDPREVIYFQMSWIYKEPKDLKVISAADDHSIMMNIAQRLRILNNTSKEMFKDAILEITKDYLGFFRRKFGDKDIRSDRPLKNEYMHIILKECGIQISENNGIMVIIELQRKEKKADE